MLTAFAFHCSDARIKGSSASSSNPSNRLPRRKNGWLQLRHLVEHCTSKSTKSSSFCSLIRSLINNNTSIDQWIPPSSPSSVCSLASTYPSRTLSRPSYIKLEDQTLLQTQALTAISTFRCLPLQLTCLRHHKPPPHLLSLRPLHLSQIHLPMLNRPYPLGHLCPSGTPPCRCRVQTPRTLA